MFSALDYGKYMLRRYRGLFGRLLLFHRSQKCQTSPRDLMPARGDVNQIALFHRKRDAQLLSAALVDQAQFSDCGFVVVHS